MQKGLRMQPNVYLEPKWLRCLLVSSNSNDTSPSGTQQQAKKKSQERENGGRQKNGEGARQKDVGLQPTGRW